MKREIFSISLILSILLVACSKEIDMDYRSISPLYVIEAYVTNEKIEALITQTRNMEESQQKNTNISDAKILLTDNNGMSEELIYQEDGYYKPTLALRGEVGKKYSINVTIGENNFTSHSEMNDSVEIKDFYFHWMPILNTKVLFCRFSIQDIAESDNFYYYIMYRNGELYNWNVFHDKGIDGGIISEDIFCMVETMTEDDKDMILYENDTIDLEIRSIDRQAYDYLYSLGLGTNPVRNFTGDCLGYFSAYFSSKKQVTFSYNNIINR